VYKQGIRAWTRPLLPSVRACLWPLAFVMLLGLAPAAQAVNLSVSQLSDSTSAWRNSDGTASSGDSSDPAPVGALVVYDVTLSNSDTAAGTNVAAVFDLPAGTRAANLPAACSAATQTRIECLYPTFAGNSQMTLKLLVDTQGLNPGAVTTYAAIGNAASRPSPATPISGLANSDPFFSGDSNPANNRLSQQTTLTNAADLALQKSAAPATVIGGGEVTYVLTVRNLGPSTATGFTVVDTLPVGATVVANSFNGSGWTFNAGTVTATYAGSLAAGSTATFQFRARLQVGSGTVTNHARVRSTGVTDPRPDNDNAQVDTVVTTGADLQLSMTPSPAPATTDQAVEFVMTARNNGPATSDTVSITGTLPAGFNYTGVTAPAGWTCSATGVNVTCNRSGSMASGAVEVLRLQTTAPGTPGNYTASMVIASAITPDPNDPNRGTDNNTATTQVSVLADGADLALGKTKVAVQGGGPKVPAGNTSDSDMRSTLRLTNNGPSRVTGQVQIVDVLALGEEYRGVESGPFTCSAAPAAWTSGQRQVVTCNYTGALPVAVNAATPFATLQLITRAREQGTLTNNACTGGSAPSGGPASLQPLTEGGVNQDKVTANNCSGSSVAATAQAADLSISKQTVADGNDDIVQVNENRLRYEITVTNLGAPTTGVVVQDPLPGWVAQGSNRTVAEATTPTGWSACIITAGTLTCRSGTAVLASNQSVTITVTLHNAGNTPGFLLDSVGRTAASASNSTCVASGNVPAGGHFHCNTAGVGIDGSVAGSLGETNWGNNNASDWVRVERVANVQTQAKDITTGATSGKAGVESRYRIQYRNQGPSTVPGIVYRDTFTLLPGDSGFTVLQAEVAGSPAVACSFSERETQIIQSTTAGGLSYRNSDASNPRTLTLVCPARSLGNDQVDTVNLAIRPNVNADNSGRVFSNTASFAINGGAQGSNADGAWNYNSVATTADDEKQAVLTFGSGEVDLLVQKNDTGFTGGIDPLPFNPEDAGSNLITYRIRTSNQGPSLATDVRVLDALVPPAGKTVTYLGASATATGSYSAARCTVIGGNPTLAGDGSSALRLDCQMPGSGFAGSDEDGAIAANTFSDLYIRYRYDTAPDGGGDTLRNGVTVHSAETRVTGNDIGADADPSNNSTEETTTIFMRSDVSVAKTMVTRAPDASPLVALPASVSVVSVRQPFWYVLTGRNNGNGQSLSQDRSATSQLQGTGTVVTDTLPAGVVVTGAITWTKAGPAYPGATANGGGSCVLSGVTITCEVGDLTYAAGNPGQVRILVPARWDTLPAGSTAPRGTSFNDARISTEQVDENPGNDTTRVPLDVVNLSLSGTVFVDSDQAGGNGGSQQAGEPGIAGVSVRLRGTDAQGNAVDLVTTTDASGHYRFDNLSPSDAVGYQVQQVPVTGYQNSSFAPPTTGSDAATFNPESYRADADGTGLSQYIAVLGVDTVVTGGTIGSQGATATRYDFPEVRRPSLSGYVYVDLDFNNLRTVGSDPAIAGATIELLDASTGAVLRSTQTDSNGQYRFDDLDPTLTYSLREPLPAGPYSNRPSAVTAGTIGGGACAPGTCVAGNAVSDAGGSDAASTDRLSRIDLGRGLDGENFNFGENPTGASISGRVWLDTDNDGVIDASETGIGNVTVRLTGTDRNGAAVDLTTTTAADGTWSFAGLLPGTYVVTEPDQPTGTLNGRTVAGSAGGTATTTQVVPSSVTAIVLAANQVATDYNFGEILAASISGRVYYDNNDNGVVDADETGIANVAVVLTGVTADGEAIHANVPTDAQGRYRFDGLRPGTYTVTEPTQPAYTTNGITRAGTVAGSSVGVATDRATVPSAISTIVLGSGMQSIDNDFGEIADTPDLVVSKRALSPVFTVNNIARYAISVRNIGPRDTTSAYEVADRLPAGLTLAAVPVGDGWQCEGAVGADRFRCTSSVVIAANARLPAEIAVEAMVAAAAANAGQVDNAVLVRGGGEDAAHLPSAAEQAAFEGAVSDLPVCDPAITQNACRVPNKVQLAASVGGTVWYDVGDGDQVLDGGDQRLPSWIVELVDPATGSVVRSTTTGADGSYRFGDVVPGMKWNIRFRDPQSNVLWPWPVTRESSAAPQQACAADAAIAGGTSSTCRVDAQGVSQLEVVLAAGQHLPGQSLPVDPSGVVYDAVSRDPVPGSVVTLAPVGTCAGFDPATAILNAAGGGYRIDGTSISMTVGKEGFYQFAFSAAAPARCEFRLTVTPPSGYQFVSQLIAPEGSALSPPGNSGANYLVQPNGTAPSGAVGMDTRYHLELFAGSATAAVVHNHLPLDTAVATGLVITKTGDRQTAEIGDTVQYTLTVRQTAGSALQTVNVIDRLPRGFTYIDGTARVDGRAAAEPVGRPGPLLGFNVGGLAVGRQVVLTYRVRIGVGAQQGDGINRAQAHGCSIAGGCIETTLVAPLPGALASNQAQYRVRVTGGVFTNDTCVLGKVFVDCNGNHVQDSEELGIPGVRLYFSDGTWLVSDSEGKYSYCGLPPQSHTLKVDATTLPQGARLTTSSNRNLGDADSLFLDLKNGELHRADFVEGSCSNPVLEQVKARRTQGEVRAPETEAGQGALRFESKPARAPQQATDSANQRPIVQPRSEPPQDAAAPEVQR